MHDGGDAGKGDVKANLRVGGGCRPKLSIITVCCDGINGRNGRD